MMYKIITSSDDPEKVADTLIEAFQDSPFKELTINRDKLLSIIDLFCADVSNMDRAIVMAVEEDGRYVGAVAMTTMDDHFAFADHKVGHEMIWWVHKDYRKTKVGKELKNAIDEWCKLKGLQYILMGHYHNEYTETMQKMYTKKLGLTPVEYSYWKKVEH